MVAPQTLQGSGCLFSARGIHCSARLFCTGAHGYRMYVRHLHKLGHLRLNHHTQVRREQTAKLCAFSRESLAASFFVVSPAQVQRIPATGLVQTGAGMRESVNMVEVWYNRGDVNVLNILEFYADL